MATGVTLRERHSTGSVELSYSGKMPSSEVLGLPHGSYKPIEGVGDANRFYFGENLDVMLSLLDDPDVLGQVRCIYIDPPYSTKMGFVDRSTEYAYSDHLSGAPYLEFLRRRIIVLRELMADDGVFFLHLDQNVVFEAKLLLDEVFGAENFRNFITRVKCNRKNYTKNVFGNISDHILFYSKTHNYVWNRPFEAWDEEGIEREYPYFDSATGRRYKRVPIHAPGHRNGSTGGPWRGKLPPKGKHWQYVPSTLDDFDARGEIYWSPNGNPRRKVFFDQSEGLARQDIWTDFRDAHNQNIRITGYPTEKNYEMVRMIVAAGSSPGDLVMDSFCGSGTTLEAAAELGRRFIGDYALHDTKGKPDPRPSDCWVYLWA